MLCMNIFAKKDPERVVCDIGTMWDEIIQDLVASEAFSIGGV